MEQVVACMNFEQEVKDLNFFRNLLALKVANLAAIYHARVLREFLPFSLSCLVMFARGISRNKELYLCQ